MKNRTIAHLCLPSLHDERSAENRLSLFADCPGRILDPSSSLPLHIIKRDDSPQIEFCLVAGCVTSYSQGGGLITFAICDVERAEASAYLFLRLVISCLGSSLEVLLSPA